MFGHASHGSVRKIGPSTSAFLAGAAIGRGGNGFVWSATGISATLISDNLVPTLLMPRRGRFLAPIEPGFMCAGRNGGLRDCSAAKGGICAHQFHRKRCEDPPAFRNVLRHAGANMRNRLLMAIWIGALALCSRPATSRNFYRRTDLRAFADLAGSTAFMDTDRQCRRGDRLARRRQADAREGDGGECICHRARPSAHALCAAQWRRAGRRDQRPAETGR